MQIVQLVVPDEVIARHETLGQDLQHRLQRFLAFFHFAVATIDDVAKLHHLERKPGGHAGRHTRKVCRNSDADHWASDCIHTLGLKES